MMELFGVGPWYDGDGLARLGGRLVLDLACATVLIRTIYFRIYGSREYVFTYYLFNLITFCLCLLLQKVPLQLGFAFGLFAVFGILRYRTEALRLRDLSYLFVVIGIALVNALANERISVAELLAVNAAIIGLTAGLEAASARPQVLSTPLTYDRIDLLRPGNAAELRRNIVDRTGLSVVRIEVIRVDMARHSAELEVFYTGVSS